MVVKVIAEGCVGEMMRVVQVTVCCTTQAMLWYECECAWSVRTLWNGGTLVPNLRGGSG